MLKCLSVPESKNVRFSKLKARLIAKEILDSELKGKTDWKWVEDWENNNFEMLSKNIADGIKEQCKTTMDVPRYKIMVQVMIGQMRDQGIKISSHCLWDTTTDNFATVSFQNQQVFATAIVFALKTD